MALTIDQNSADRSAVVFGYVMTLIPNYQPDPAMAAYQRLMPSAALADDSVYNSLIIVA